MTTELERAAPLPPPPRFDPRPDREPQIDPVWQRMRSDSLLPELYMPPMMSGPRPTWMRIVASVLIGIFLLATALGICLTYGPPHWSI